MWKILFGPLSSQACVYFYALSILAFFAATFIILASLVYLANKRKLELKNVYPGIIIATNLYLAYFVNRLLYTMCTKSLS